MLISTTAACTSLLCVLTVLMSAAKTCLLMMPRLGLHPLYIPNDIKMGVLVNAAAAQPPAGPFLLTQSLTLPHLPNLSALCSDSLSRAHTLGNPSAERTPPRRHATRMRMVAHLAGQGQG